MGGDSAVIGAGVAAVGAGVAAVVGGGLGDAAGVGTALGGTPAAAAAAGGAALVVMVVVVSVTRLSTPAVNVAATATAMALLMGKARGAC